MKLQELRYCPKCKKKTMHLLGDLILVKNELGQCDIDHIAVCLECSKEDGYEDDNIMWTVEMKLSGE